MENKELEIAYFLSFCIEQYKHKHQMSGNETVSLFDKYDILLYLEENFEVLHTQGHQWLIEEIDELINERRKELVRNIVSTLGDFSSEKIIVVNLNDVNEGILGLIASSLSSKYCVPSIVLAKSKGTLKGSLRSYGDFSLTSLIDYLRPLLIKGGGHNEAGGISLKEENFAQLVASCKEYMKDKVIKKLPLKVIKLDACDLNEDLYEYINNLRPFGNGHEKVRFGMEFYSSQVNYIGARQEHIKVNFTAYQSLIGFNMSEQIHDINLGIGSVDKNIFNNNRIRTTWHT